MKNAEKEDQINNRIQHAVFEGLDIF